VYGVGIGCRLWGERGGEVWREDNEEVFRFLRGGYGPTAAKTRKKVGGGGAGRGREKGRLTERER